MRRRSDPGEGSVQENYGESDLDLIGKFLAHIDRR
jgi:hypothetical protein